MAACAPRGVPVTLKMRTGWCDAERNALALARAAETPASRWSPCTAARASRATRGLAEYDTVAAVKAALRIPVVANGDIDSPAQGAAGAARTPAPTR